jgi:hypothetical protein
MSRETVNSVRAWLRNVERIELKAFKQDVQKVWDDIFA